MRIHEAIASRRTEILEDWMARARAVARRLELDEPALLDGVPRLLDALIDWLQHDRAVDARQYEQGAEHHAVHRLRQGYALPQIVGEYSALRAAIVAQVGGLLTTGAGDDLERVAAAIDLAIVDAVGRATVERRRAEAEHEDRLRDVIDNAPAMIFIKDYRRGDGVFLMANELYARRFAVDRRAIIGQTDYQAHPTVDRALIDVVREHDLEVMQTNATVRVEEVFPEADGLHTYLVLKFPLHDADGVPYAVCGIATDVTAEKATAQARERFMGILGHDLRNPLSVISMAAGSIGHLVGEDGTVTQLAAKIEATAQQMGAMIGDLLDFTRGRLGGGIPIVPARADLAAIARSVVDDLTSTRPDRRIRLTTSGDLGGCWDGDRLRQALGNLLTNATEHGGEAEIEVDLADRGDWIELRVANQGNPIAPEVQRTLFEPFQRRKDSRGLGLGLYIVHEIVRGHGGRIDVHSDAGGTAFVCRLPRAA